LIARIRNGLIILYQNGGSARVCYLIFNIRNFFGRNTRNFPLKT